MKLKWKHNRDKSIFDLENNGLRICIHKYIGLGDALFLTCYALEMRQIDLHTKDFDEAVQRAKQIIKARIKVYNDFAEDFINGE